MKRLMVLGLVVSLMMASGCANQQKAQEKAFEEDVTAYLQEAGNVGMSCVLVKDNKIVYNQNFGVKDLDTKEPIDDQTIFRIASISKSFTSTSLMQLIDKGVLSLKDDVSDLIGFKVRNPKYPQTVITLEMILSHTSSLNDSQGYFTLDVINPETAENCEKCYNSYEPGCGYEYCNLNFNIAGTILERYSGERFDQYVVKNILRPLGLYGGYCVDSLDASRFAHLYNYWGGEYVRSDAAYDPRSEEIANYVMGKDTPVFSPTGGMKISALDLAKYMIMHMNYGETPLVKDAEGNNLRIIPEYLSKEMQTPRSSDENYGLALWVSDEYSPGVNLVGHTGNAYGQLSLMFFNPEKKYGFVITSSGSKDQNIRYEVATRMYKHFIEGGK